VNILFADKWISEDQGFDSGVSRRYSAWDAYRSADFVTYPSTYEGFGNASRETIYFRMGSADGRWRRS